MRNITSVFAEVGRTPTKIFCEKCQRKTPHQLIDERDGCERYACSSCGAEREYRVK